MYSQFFNNLNPLWNPVPPSGKSISDMLRAIKLQRFRTGAHKNAIQSMRKKEGYISAAWGDTEKLQYVQMNFKFDFGFKLQTFHQRLLISIKRHTQS